MTFGSMNEKVSASIMFVKTIKNIPKKYETHERYSNKQKVSRVVNLYKKLFSLRHDCSLSDYYPKLKGTLDELNFINPQYWI